MMLNGKFIYTARQKTKYYSLLDNSGSSPSYKKIPTLTRRGRQPDIRAK